MKELLLLANKSIEKIPDPCNGKQHCQSILRRKNMKLVKQSEIITYQPTIFDTVNIISVITEDPKTSHKLSKTIRQAGKEGSHRSLYSDTKKCENILNENNVKITKQRLLKAMQVLIMLKFEILLTVNYHLKILNLLLKLK